MTLQCAGCFQKIKTKEYLTCILCKKNYDLECSNVSIQRFLNTMTKEHKASWSCQICRCQKPKTDNTNTPIRSLHSNVSLKETSEFGEDFVTTRKKCNRINVSSCSDVDLSILGDTLEAENIQKQSNLASYHTKNPAESTNLTVNSTDLSVLLDTKLEKIKQSLLSDIRSTIISVTTCEISKLKLELTKTTSLLSSEQDSLKKDINKMNKTIIKLEAENTKLCKQLQEIQEQIAKCNLNFSQSESNITDIKKKVVLYGLSEQEWENYNELFDRIVYIFHEILNINVTTYIEDIKRIGRKNHARPVVIELLSKNITKHILQNRRLFKHTGLSIPEFLDDEMLQNRKKYIEILIDARRNGHRANIINNKLIIDGREYNTLNTLNTSSIDLKQKNNQKLNNEATARLSLSASNPETSSMQKTFRK